MMSFEDHIVVMIRDNPYFHVRYFRTTPTPYDIIHHIDPRLRHLSNFLSAKLQMSVTAIDPSIGITPLPMRFRKATKQLATLGPASSSFEMIEKLFLSGDESSIGFLIAI